MSRQQRRFEARKGKREVGFTRVRNKRIDGARAAAFAGFVAVGMSAMDAEAAAWREVAKSLPSARGRQRFVRPSKSDNPSYRKSIWPASKIERRAAK